FISYAATAWATMALSLAVRPGASRALMGPPTTAYRFSRTGEAYKEDLSPQDERLTELMDAALLGTVRDMKALMRDGADVNETATSVRITSLMCAVHDPAKAALLVDNGANVNVETRARQTALSSAAAYDGASETLKLLLDH